MKEELIKALLKRCEDSPDHHLRGSIIQRRKENSELDTGARIIKRYTFKNYAEFEKRKEEILNYVKLFDARFYLNPTVKSYETIGFEVLEKIASNLKLKQAESIKQTYDSVADANTGIRAGRLWVVDVDGYSAFKPDFYVQVYNYFRNIIGRETAIFFTETPNGIHILVEPHKKDPAELNKFMHNYGVTAEYKMNAATVVYYNKEK